MMRRFRRGINVVDELRRIAQEDEKASGLLYEAGLYNQAGYFLLQAMEKTLLVEIFSVIGGSKATFRDMLRSHSIEKHIDILVDVKVGNAEMRKHVKEHISNYIIDNNLYGRIHNNLRYPYFSDKFGNWSCLMATREDIDELRQKFANLQHYIADMSRMA